MRYAIIADTHGNEEALDAIFDDIEIKSARGKPIEQIVHLGDIVGYGPNPRECTEKVRDRCEIVLQGNHDRAATSKIQAPNYGLRMSGPGAYEGIHWTVRQIYYDDAAIPNRDGKSDKAWKEEVEQHTMHLVHIVRAEVYPQWLAEEVCKNVTLEKLPFSRLNSRDKIAQKFYQMVLTNPEATQLRMQYDESIKQIQDGNELQEYLKSLPKEARFENALAVHDNPMNPGNNAYLFDLKGREKNPGHRNARKIEDVFNSWNEKMPNVDVIFFGHTHLHGVYTSREHPGKIIVNPGSQMPRNLDTDKPEMDSDGNLIVTYAIWNTEVKGRRAVRIERVPVPNWKTTVEKMEAAGLPDKLS